MEMLEMLIFKSWAIPATATSFCSPHSLLIPERNYWTSQDQEQVSSLQKQRKDPSCYSWWGFGSHTTTNQSQISSLARQRGTTDPPLFSLKQMVVTFPSLFFPLLLAALGGFLCTWPLHCPYCAKFTKTAGRKAKSCPNSQKGWQDPETAPPAQEMNIKGIRGWGASLALRLSARTGL